MDYIRQLGPVVLDHRFRRMTDALLRAAEEIYDARSLQFRARWASTYQLLHSEGPMAVGQIADRLRLTHPGVIGITDEMMTAKIVTAVRDHADNRRRLLELTDPGKRMSVELFGIWKELGEAQRRRFAAAGCDIMDVMERVEDGLLERGLASEVLEKIETRRTPKPGRMKHAKKRSASPVRRATRAALGLVAGVVFGSMRFATSTEAQTPVAEHPRTINEADREALVNALSDSLIAGYIYEKTGRMLADSLRAELRGGAYDRLDTGAALAARVNQTLMRISNDRHLGVQYLRPADPGGPVRRRVAPGNAVDAVPKPMPAATSGVISFPELGIASARILSGNVGYLDLPGFSEEEEALHAIDSVMAVFADASAIIIDVGRNRGGGPSVIQHLSAYFFDRPTHLVSTFMRGMDAPRERWTASAVPGRHLPKTPLYVLTSRSTISAAESFAFGLRNHNRVTIVGERTAGGGHFGGFIPLTPGFSVFLPRGRTYNPLTNKGWEAEGLKPDVEVPYDRALETAIAIVKRNPPESD
jgi:DNA-binding MarR family transcriptional regulator